MRDVLSLVAQFERVLLSKGKEISRLAKDLASSESMRLELEQKLAICEELHRAAQKDAEAFVKYPFLYFLLSLPAFFLCLVSLSRSLVPLPHSFFASSRKSNFQAQLSPSDHSETFQQP